MNHDLILALDIGTGSARAALIDAAGSILHVAVREYEQRVPAFGWAEQRADDWWAAVQAGIHDVLAAQPQARTRIAGIVACGQMHGTVLVDDDGRPARPWVPLWNDKRTAALVARYEHDHPEHGYLPRTANPATPAWPAFKLQWLREHDPAAWARAARFCVPKDWINFRLTGVVAIDRTEAACSFLMDPRTGRWSDETCDEFGLDRAMLPPIHAPTDLLGGVTAGAAAATGLREGTPVFVGTSDFAAGLLGSGVCDAGTVSEMLGTSCIVTRVTDQPLLHPEVCNLGTVEGGWGAFMLLESGGDAMRWARRALHDRSIDYAGLVALAATAPAGSDGLFFLPYLSGERLGAHRNARAQFFGLGAAHGPAHLDRAVLEGVAFACRRHLDVLAQADGGRPVERIVASGGGARTDLWLRIKASAYGVPIVVPEQPECSLVGCAAIGLAATGAAADVRAAARTLVRYAREVQPDPAWQQRYARMQPVFDRLYRHAQALYDDLDALAADAAASPSSGPEHR